MSRFIRSIISIFILLILLSTFTLASAETIDLSGMTYDELVALKDHINLAIWNSQEWQEVTVPQGVWQVGVDIPAGTWTVKCADVGRSNSSMRYCYLQWGEQLTSDGREISTDGPKGLLFLHNPNHEAYEEGALTEYTLTLKDGEYIVIYPYYNKAVFTTYSGKPNLGFN